MTCLASASCCHSLSLDAIRAFITNQGNSCFSRGTANGSTPGFIHHTASVALNICSKAFVSAIVLSSCAHYTKTACLCAPAPLPPPPPKTLSYSKLLLQQEKAAAPAHPVPPKSTGKLYLAPTSLPELFELLSEYAKQPEEFRVIAGNTGAGVYHDWPLERVLIDIKSIPDLTKIEYSEVCKNSILEFTEYSKVCKVHTTSFVSLCTMTGSWGGFSLTSRAFLTSAKLSIVRYARCTSHLLSVCAVHMQ